VLACLGACQGFAEEWETLTGLGRRDLAAGFFFFYVLFAIVLLNLFIGIITDVYPTARERSKAEWERTITQLLEVRLHVWGCSGVWHTRAHAGLPVGTPALIIYSTVPCRTTSSHSARAC